MRSRADQVRSHLSEFFCTPEELEYAKRRLTDMLQAGLDPDKSFDILIQGKK